MGIFKQVVKSVVRIPLDVVEAIEEVVDEAATPKEQRREKK